MYHIYTCTYYIIYIIYIYTYTYLDIPIYPFFEFNIFGLNFNPYSGNDRNEPTRVLANPYNIFKNFSYSVCTLFCRILAHKMQRPPALGDGEAPSGNGQAASGAPRLTMPTEATLETLSFGEKAA